MFLAMRNIKNIIKPNNLRINKNIYTLYEQHLTISKCKDWENASASTTSVLIGDYNKDIPPKILDKLCNLKTFKTYESFNKSILNMPNAIEELHLHGKYNKPMKYNEMQKLKYLVLGNHYTQTLEDLPQSLMELYVGYSFNNPLNLNNNKNLQKLIILNPDYNKDIIFPPDANINIVYINSNHYNYQNIPHNIDKLLLGPDVHFDLLNVIKYILKQYNYSHQSIYKDNLEFERFTLLSK